MTDTDAGALRANTSHAALVKRAATWLRGSAKIPHECTPGKTRRVSCAVVMAEFVCSVCETPDAIGWAYGGRVSILVECKTSRADFYADRRKYFRQHPDRGLGMYRYYLAPAGLLTVDELPASWGLLTLDRGKIVVAKCAERQERNMAAEMVLLWSQCRRICAGRTGSPVTPSVPSEAP